jgi:hypothetical protein
MNNRVLTLMTLTLGAALFVRCSVPFYETDTDEDGLQDFSDPDDDNDGFLDIVEFYCDSDSKDSSEKPTAPEADDTSEEAQRCRQALNTSVDCSMLRAPDGKRQGEACTVPGREGVCAMGVYVCTGATLTCTPTQIGAEVCDGLDNDCDGTPDNIADTPCGTGLPGECATGTLRCVQNAPQCVPSRTPGQIAELCNGLDDDCDGPADEEIAAVGMNCETGIQGPCNPGTQICNGVGGLACVSKTVSEEVCDGEDNNCDRVPDNIESRACTDETKRGVCMFGQTACMNRMEACVTPEPTPEICNNNEDEDCDGTRDNGGNCMCVDADEDGYGTGGGCLGPDCDDDNRNIHPGVADPCDGLNNDCDSSVDEDFAPTSCEAEGAVGECVRGMTACQGRVVCLPGSPSSEICDGLDNDCVGGPDAPGPISGTGQTCTSTNAGVCAQGTTVCGRGGIRCRSNVQPATQVEACNGLDDNCDRQVDEGFAIACDAQTWGEPCNNGALRCSRGLFCASLTVGASEGTCVRLCQGPADCLTNQACQPIPGGQRICIALCDPAAQQTGCPSSQVCSQTGFCVPPLCRGGSRCPAAASRCQPQSYCTP